MIATNARKSRLPMLLTASLCLAVIGCNKPLDHLTRSPNAPVNSLSSTSAWVAVGGAAGKVTILRPSLLPGRIRETLSLDIDCYVVAVARCDSRVWISAIRSRGPQDDPGGIYRLDLTNGSTHLVAPSSSYGGEASSLFVIGTDHDLELIACNARGAFRVSPSGVVRHVIDQPTDEVRHWAVVGGRTLVAYTRSNKLWAVPLESQALQEGWRPLAVPADDLARSHLNGEIVAAIEGQWRLIPFDSEEVSVDGESRILAPWAGTMGSSCVLLDGSQLVVVEATDYPARTTWKGGTWTLESRQLSVMDAVASNPGDDP